MMQPAINKPYVKQYDEQGILTNPIESAYLNAPNSNRASRREGTPRFHGNGNQIHLSVYPKGKYLRAIQVVPAKIIFQHEELITIPSKRIEHYILK